MFSRLFKFIDEYKDLKHMAYHDGLTGLYNRNWLTKNLKTIKSNFVYFIDINDLHEINKKGHTIGDMHIINIVNWIPQRDGNILVRYGGDEFILFSDDSNLLVENKLYTFGMAEITSNIPDAIQMADRIMILEKEKQGFKRTQ